MEKHHLRRLFAYDLWANKRVLEALGALAPLDASDPLPKLFSHILAAQDVWLTHIHGRPLSIRTAWPERDPETWPERLRTLNDAWIHLLDTWEGSFDTLISYRGLRGEPFETPLHEILLHVIIHGQHHRAQIASQLRQHGHPPPSTDFIAFTFQPQPE